MEIRLSIILPVYNVEAYIRKCLVSLVNQDLADYELIIIDNASTDNSLRICEEFKEKYDFIRLYSQEKNTSPGGARNVGLSMALGKYITFVDSDDYVELNYCSKMLDAMERYNLDMVTCNYYLILENGIMSAWRTDNVSLRNLYENRVLNKKEILEAHALGFVASNLWGRIYKKRIFEAGRIQFPICPNAGDAVPSVQILEQCKRVFILPDLLYYYYRKRQGNISSTSQTIFLSPNQLVSPFIQTSRAIELFHKISSNIISRKHLEIYVRYRKNYLIQLYLDYQFVAFCALLVSGEIYNGGSYCFFGASSASDRFIDLLDDKQKSLFFVDNNKCLHGKTYKGYDVLPPSALKNKENKIFITSIYLTEIVSQLIDMGAIGSIANIMPYSGKTKIEQAFIDGFSYLFSALEKTGEATKY